MFLLQIYKYSYTKIILSPIYKYRYTMKIKKWKNCLLTKDEYNETLSKPKSSLAASSSYSPNVSMWKLIFTSKYYKIYIVGQLFFFLPNILYPQAALLNLLDCIFSTRYFHFGHGVSWQPFIHEFSYRHYRISINWPDYLEKYLLH